MKTWKRNVYGNWISYQNLDSSRLLCSRPRTCTIDWMVWNEVSTDCVVTQVKTASRTMLLVTQFFLCFVQTCCILLDLEEEMYTAIREATRTQTVPRGLMCSRPRTCTIDGMDGLE